MLSVDSKSVTLHQLDESRCEVRFDGQSVGIFADTDDGDGWAAT